MHFVLKVRMWLPFFNNPGKLSSWNPVLVFGGSCFDLHLQMFPVLSNPGRRPMHMHFVFKVRMWLPFFNTPGKLGSWNPVLVFDGFCFYLHLQMFPILLYPGRRPMHMHFVYKVRMWLPFFNTPGKPSFLNFILVLKAHVFIYTCRCFQYCPILVGGPCTCILLSRCACGFLSSILLANLVPGI